MSRGCNGVLVAMGTTLAGDRPQAVTTARRVCRAVILKVSRAERRPGLLRVLWREHPWASSLSRISSLGWALPCPHALTFGCSHHAVQPAKVTGAQFPVIGGQDPHMCHSPISDLHKVSYRGWGGRDRLRTILAQGGILGALPATVPRPHAVAGHVQKPPRGVPGLQTVF